MEVRTLVAGGAITSVVTGFLVGLTAAPAAASSDDITSPADQAVVTEGPGVRISADLDLAEQAKLRLRGPTDDSFHTVDKGQGDLEYHLDISCPEYARPCSGTKPAPNGTYTVQVHRTGLLLGGGVDDQHTFTLRVPPRRPSDVSIKAKGPDTLRLTWDHGAEPDLTGYDVSDASGTRVQRVSADNSCDHGSCSTVVEVPPREEGERVAYTVRARRSVEPGSNTTVASAPSDRVAVTLPAASPSPAPQVLRADDTTGAPSSGHPSPSPPSRSTRSTLPTFQPLASQSELPLPADAEQRNDVFGQGLDYPLPTLTTPTPQPGGQADALAAPSFDAGQETAPPRSMTSAIGMAPSEWWKTVALGLVLLLIAAHLGAWTWRTRPVPPHINPKKDRMRASKAPATALAARRGTHSGASQREAGALTGQRGRRRRPRTRE